MINSKTRLCITTIVSADAFRAYIPMWIMTWQKAYPEYFFRVYLRGPLDEYTAKTLSMIPDGKWQVKTNQFLDYPTRESTCNTLRHLIPEEEFYSYDYVYITDIDFLAFHHTPGHLEYFAGQMAKMKSLFASFRGPLKKPYRRNISKIGWKRKYRRVVDGTLMLKSPEFFDATRRVRNQYQRIVKAGSHDDLDKHPSCSYREYNEVMFYRICWKSGLKTPSIRKCFQNGDPFNMLYRDIHLGDFKFDNRWMNLKRMKDKIQNQNLCNFRLLEQNPLWLQICERCCEEPMVHDVIQNLRLHIQQRG